MWEKNAASLDVSMSYVGHYACKNSEYRDHGSPLDIQSLEWSVCHIRYGKMLIKSTMLINTLLIIYESVSL